MAETPARRLVLIGLSSRVAVTGFALLNTFLLARWLGPAGFGTYVLFVRAVSVLTMFGDFGQAQSATAFFGRLERWSSALHAAYLRSVAMASLATAAGAAALLWGGGAMLLPGFPTRWLALVCAILPLTIYSNFWFGMMVGRGEIGVLNGVRVLGSALTLLATIVFVGLLPGGTEAALKAFVAITVVQVAVMGAVTLRRAARAPSSESAAPAARELAGFGFRAYGNVIFYVLWTAAPLFFLNAFHGAAAVGVFSIAQQLVDKVLLPVHAMQEAIYRRLGSVSPAAAAAATTRYLRGTMAGTAVAAVAGLPALAWGVPYLLGAEYAITGRLTALLLLGVPFMGVLMVLDPYFISALRRPGLASLLAAANVVMAATLSLALIPPGAAHGAAAALVLTQAFGAVAALLTYKHRSGLEWNQLLRSPARATAPAGMDGS